MKNRYVGMLIVGVAVLFFILVLSFNNALNSIVNTSCTHGMECPMHFTLFTQEIISYSLIGLLVLIGIVIAFFMKDEHTTIIHNNHEKKKELTEEEKKEKLESLDEEEKRVMNVILREDGSVYQSDIIKETGLGKVKVSRLLDKIEGRGLIERKRRGMTNVIILKH